MYVCMYVSRYSFNRRARVTVVSTEADSHSCISITANSELHSWGAEAGGEGEGAQVTLTAFRHARSVLQYPHVRIVQPNDGCIRDPHQTPTRAPRDSGRQPPVRGHRQDYVQVPAEAAPPPRARQAGSATAATTTTTAVAAKPSTGLPLRPNGKRRRVESGPKAVGSNVAQAEGSRQTAAPAAAITAAAAATTEAGSASGRAPAGIQPGRQPPPSAAETTVPSSSTDDTATATNTTSTSTGAESVAPTAAASDSAPSGRKGLAKSGKSYHALSLRSCQCSVSAYGTIPGNKELSSLHIAR